MLSLAITQSYFGWFVTLLPPPSTLASPPTSAGGRGWALGGALLTMNFGTPNMFVILWFELGYGTNPPLGTLML
jgi:hypothetical protein